MGEPTILNEIISKIIKTHNFNNIDVVIGIEYGGIPLAVGVSLITGVPFAILRKKKKAYGTEKRIEGYQKFGNVLLLDDVKTTGHSIELAKEYLFDMGYKIIATDVAYNRIK
jgi:orotate phosphoribosyltransferase